VARLDGQVAAADHRPEGGGPGDEAARELRTAPSPVPLDAERTDHRLPADTRRRKADARGGGGLLRAGDGDRLGQRVSRFCVPVGSPRLRDPFAGHNRGDCGQDLRALLSGHRPRRGATALDVGLRGRQCLVRPGPMPRGRLEAHRNRGTLVWRQMGDVRLVPVRQIRLCGLVGPGDRLRRSAERQLLGTVVSGLPRASVAQARPDHGRESRPRIVSAVAGRRPRLARAARTDGPRGLSSFRAARRIRPGGGFR
jgi:hypothetical protein